MLFIILALTNFENAVIQYVGLRDTQLTITKPKNTKRKETKKQTKKKVTIYLLLKCRLMA